MSRIFITGDTHGGIDITKINSKYFPTQKELTKDDFLIIAGDFGCVWDGKNKDSWWQKWFEQKNFTTLFVDGNHENFNLLNGYPVSNWNGGRVQFIKPSVIHLMRGEVYSIAGKKIFAFGGAESHDKQYRTENISWWEQEMPSYEEMDYGVRNLEKGAVDIIVSHEAPYQVISNHFQGIDSNPLSKFFDFISDNFEYKDWYFGHHHIDFEDGRFHAMYNNIKEIL